LNKTRILKLDGSVEQALLNIGFGNTVIADKVVSILSPNSSPMKRLKDEAREEKRLIDATHGRKTRAIIVTETNHIILSAIQAETVSHRMAKLYKDKTLQEK
jgi:extracellular matrix regulatory protein A